MAVGKPSAEGYVYYKKPGYINRLYIPEALEYLSSGATLAESKTLERVKERIRAQETTALASFASALGKPHRADEGEKALIEIVNDNMELNNTIFEMLQKVESVKGEREQIREAAAKIVEDYIWKEGGSFESNPELTSALSNIGLQIEELINNMGPYDIQGKANTLGNLVERILPGLLNIALYKSAAERKEDLKTFIEENAFEYTGNILSGRGRTKKTYDLEGHLGAKDFPIQVKAHYNENKLGDMNIITSGILSSFLTQSVSQSAVDYLRFALVQQHVRNIPGYAEAISSLRSYKSLPDTTISKTSNPHAIEKLDKNGISSDLAASYEIMKTLVTVNFLSRIENDKRRTLIILDLGHSAGAARIIRVSEVVGMLQQDDLSKHFKFEARDTLTGDGRGNLVQWIRPNRIAGGDDYPTWYRKTNIGDVLDKIKVTMTFNYFGN